MTQPFRLDINSIQFEIQVCPIIFGTASDKHLAKAVHEVKHGYWTRKNAADYLTVKVLEQLPEEWSEYTHWVREMALHRINCELNYN